MTLPSQLAGQRPEQIFPGYVFDLDGTVYLGDTALPGAVDAMQRIRNSGSRITFVTNKPLETAADYAQKLTHLGIPAGERDVVTAVDSLLFYMQQRHPEAKVLTIAEPVVMDAISAHGFVITEDPSRANVVVVSFDRTFSYAKLNAAYRAVRLHGAALVATNPDPYCPTPDGGLPDCASMLAAVEACTGARAEAITGKPSRHMATTVLSRLGISAGRVAMVGDRIDTDMAMARSMGMTGILVLSGASSWQDLETAADQPAYIIDGLHQLLPDVRHEIPRNGATQ